MLTPEQIDEIDSKIWSKTVDRGKPMGEFVRKFARAIEAEVRAQDEALIRQMLEAMEKLDEAFCSDDYGSHEGRTQGRMALIAVRAGAHAANARLKKEAP